MELKKNSIKKKLESTWLTHKIRNLGYETVITPQKTNKK
jgi:hypothetical protein